MSNAPLRPRSSLLWRGVSLAVCLAAASQLLTVEPVRGAPAGGPLTVLAAQNDGASSTPVIRQQPANTPVPVRPPGLVSGPVRTPPQVAGVVVEDSLTGGGLIPTGSCPTGRAMAETVGEGLILKVRGPCVGSSTVASARTVIPGLRIPDGEIRFETRFVDGIERGSLMLVLRYGETQDRIMGHAFVIGPTTGATIIVFSASGARVIGLKPKQTSVAWGDWNTVAIRVQGSGLWLLVNDEPILYAEDGGFTDGGVLIGLNRSGNAGDEAETSAVLRNVRVSALEGSDPSLTPAYAAPPPRRSDPNATPSCDYGTPRLERDPDGVQRWYCDQTDWNSQ